MRSDAYRDEFKVRIFSGLFFAFVLFFSMFWLTAKVPGLWILVVLLGGIKAPWAWFRWNMMDFLKESGYTAFDYQVNSPSKKYLHTAWEIHSWMGMLTVPYYIAVVLFGWFFVW